MLREEPLFDAAAFALEVRLAMARQNLSLRKLQAQIGVDQASIHRCAVKQLPPSVENYLRLRLWLDRLLEDEAEAEQQHYLDRERDDREDIATAIRGIGEERDG